jgi:Holliday junction resolvase RusA-like endonuclease
MINFIIPGEPTAKQRPKHGNGFTYTPTKTVNYETLVKEIFATRFPNHQLLEGPLKLSVIAYFTIPESGGKKVREQKRNGTLRPVKKPDWDNIGKIVSDALNTIAVE